MARTSSTPAPPPSCRLPSALAYVSCQPGTYNSRFAFHLGCARGALGCELVTRRGGSPTICPTRHTGRWQRSTPHPASARRRPSATWGFHLARTGVNASCGACVHSFCLTCARRAGSVRIQYRLVSTASILSKAALRVLRMGVSIHARLAYAAHLDSHRPRAQPRSRTRPRFRGSTRISVFSRPCSLSPGAWATERHAGCLRSLSAPLCSRSPRRSSPLVPFHPV
ncbi:hypothetical protein BD413DRAFT_280643 [Trametes elegans]|nr:hypothetical protein BD413DRAFT_280643 [Trametes elegans]